MDDLHQFSLSPSGMLICDLQICLSPSGMLICDLQVCLAWKIDQ